MEIWNGTSFYSRTISWKLKTLLKTSTMQIIYTGFGKINSMKFYKEKSMFMTNIKNSPNIQLRNNTLNQAENYKYLADFITPTGSLNYTINEWKNQILGFTAESSTIISVIDQQGLHMLARKRYHQAIILPNSYLYHGYKFRFFSPPWTWGLVFLARAPARA